MFSAPVYYCFLSFIIYFKDIPGTRYTIYMSQILTIHQLFFSLFLNQIHTRYLILYIRVHGLCVFVCVFFSGVFQVVFPGGFVDTSSFFCFFVFLFLNQIHTRHGLGCVCVCFSFFFSTVVFPEGFVVLLWTSRPDLFAQKPGPDKTPSTL